MRKLSRAKRKKHKENIKKKSNSQKRKERKQRKMLEEQRFKEKKQREKRSKVIAKMMLIFPTTIGAIGGIVYAILEKTNIFGIIFTSVIGAMLGLGTVFIICIAYLMLEIKKEEKTKKGDF